MNFEEKPAAEIKKTRQGKLDMIAQAQGTRWHSYMNGPGARKQPVKLPYIKFQKFSDEWHKYNVYFCFFQRMTLRAGNSYLHKNLDISADPDAAIDTMFFAVCRYPVQATPAWNMHGEYSDFVYNVSDDNTSHSAPVSPDLHYAQKLPDIFQFVESICKLTQEEKQAVIEQCL